MSARRPLSLVARIGLLTGALVTLFWLAAAGVTVNLLYREVNRVFDRDLRAAAERILPIVVHEYFDDGENERGNTLNRGGRGNVARDLQRVEDREDDIEFAVVSGNFGLLLRSASAADIAFPTETGFSSDGTWRFYVDQARRGDVTIAVARPLAARRELAMAALTALSLPLLVVIPLTLIGIAFTVRRGVRPVDDLREELETRGPGNLAPLDDGDMPRELKPVVGSTNALMARLEAGFEAERSFAANAAHEMRTPVAGAIAQAQRLKSESADPAVIARAGEIETTLKRLNRYSEKLMQMARAEGARLRLATASDLRPVARLIVDDARRGATQADIALELPQAPVDSDLDPDAFGIVLRNLLENALRHGAAGAPVVVRLTPDRVLSVANAGPALTPDELARLGRRFMRGGGAGDGAGLGLSIVHIVAERSGSGFELVSPRPGHSDGVEARFSFAAPGAPGH